ncbi:hypothetical protein HYU91_03300 [Candidatus Collierbacteria bacterium]|nr:hypothetical protein [Candidatus Collierbacteria bacterium]
MSPLVIQNEILDISRQLTGIYGAEKVILFGSAASNPQVANDLDFLIIKTDVPVSGLDRMRQVRNMIKKTVAADFIILTPGELEDRVRLGDPFILQITNFGKTLYG